MFAVIEIGGRQYPVQEKDELLIEKIPGEVNKNVTVKTVVLLAKSDSDIFIGTPYVEGATVELKIVAEVIGDKIRIFKMKPKERQGRRKGHRQRYWKVKVLKITKVNGKSKEKVESKEKKVESKEKKAKKVTKKI